MTVDNSNSIIVIILIIQSIISQNEHIYFLYSWVYFNASTFVVLLVRISDAAC